MQLNEWHIALPDIVRLQKDFEQKYQTELSDAAFNGRRICKLYQEWQQHEE